jgi:hypothetical protein
MVAILASANQVTVARGLHLPPPPAVDFAFAIAPHALPPILPLKGA